MADSTTRITLKEVVSMAVESKLSNYAQDVQQEVAAKIKEDIEEQIFLEKADDIRKQAFAAAKKDINDEQVKAIKETLREGVVVGIAIGLLVNELSFLIGSIEDATGHKTLASLILILILSLTCFTLLLSDFVKRASKIGITSIV